MSEFEVKKINYGGDAYTPVDEVARELANPTGGNTGDVLTKTAAGTEWAAPSGGGGGNSIPVVTLTADTNIDLSETEIQIPLTSDVSAEDVSAWIAEGKPFILDVVLTASYQYSEFMTFEFPIEAKAGNRIDLGSMASGEPGLYVWSLGDIIEPFLLIGDKIAPHNGYLYVANNTFILMIQDADNGVSRAPAAVAYSIEINGTAIGWGQRMGGQVADFKEIISYYAKDANNAISKYPEMINAISLWERYNEGESYQTRSERFYHLTNWTTEASAETDPETGETIVEATSAVFTSDPFLSGSSYVVRQITVDLTAQYGNQLSFVDIPQGAVLGSADNPFVISILNSVYGPLKTSAKEAGAVGESTSDISLDNATPADVLAYAQSGRLPHIVVMAKTTADDTTGTYYSATRINDIGSSLSASYTEISTDMPVGGTSSQVQTSIYNVSVSITASRVTMRIVAGIESTRAV